MNNMSDLSFTQTKRSMCSKPLPRPSAQYKSWWRIVAEHNRKPKVLTLRENGVKVKVVESYKKNEAIKPYNWMANK